MVQLAFVQQVTLLTSILLGFSFPVVAQLATLDVSNRRQSQGSAAEATGWKLSAALSLFIVSAAAMLVSTFIGLALILILTSDQVQPDQALPQKVAANVEAVARLSSMWLWPLLTGLLSFLGAFALLGWLRSRITGIVSTLAITMAVFIMLMVWIVLSDL